MGRAAMIVVDSSALIANLEDEPKAEQFLQILRGNLPRFVGAATVYETGIVIGSRRGFESAIEVKALLAELGIDVVPFAEQHISVALEAYGRYGKGIHPKARLNFGDCAAYALAKSMNAPLLFKGNDFSETDILPCV
jgi:ribonuclease VapC